MDLENIIYELESVESIFRLFSCLSMEAQIKDVAIISLDYIDKTQEIIRKLKSDI